jgi:IPTL-CTERM motif
MTRSTRFTNTISAWFFPLLSAFATIAAISSPAAAQSASDSTFLDANWALTQFTAGLGGSSTAAQSLSGGNPGAFRNVTDVLNAAPPGSQTIVLSTSIYTPFTYSPAVSGAIGSINYSEDAACTGGCFGSGQSTGPALLQGGNLYILSSSTVITGPGAAWANHTLNGLTAADFGLVNVTPTGIFDNTQHPNFSAGGAPIQLGFFRANGTSINGGAYTLSAGIDNWQVTILAGAAPVAIDLPTLSQWSVAALALAIALIGLAWTRRRR